MKRKEKLHQIIVNINFDRMSCSGNDRFVSYLWHSGSVPLTSSKNLRILRKEVAVRVTFLHQDSGGKNPFIPFHFPQFLVVYKPFANIRIKCSVRSAVFSFRLTHSRSFQDFFIALLDLSLNQLQ